MGVRRFGERGEGERAREREASGPSPPEGGGGGGDGPLLRKERRRLSVQPPRGRKAGSQRPPVGVDYEKSLCPSPPRIPFSFRADFTLATVPPLSGRGGRRGRGGRWAPTAPDTPDPSPEFINQRKTPLLDEMKLKARINGEKVHDVGYRVFLLDLALELGIERFAAYNRIDGGLEVVSVMAEGDDDQIAALRELVASKRPKDARVSDVVIEEYDGRIVSTTDYSQSLMIQIISDGLLALQRIERGKAIMI